MNNYRKNRQNSIVQSTTKDSIVPRAYNESPSPSPDSSTPSSRGSMIEDSNAFPNKSSYPSNNIRSNISSNTFSFMSEQRILNRTQSLNKTESKSNENESTTN
jgi:hypothetical protein